MSMSETKHSALSYTVGFILALVCTFIPYYLVTHHTLTGDRLLAAIIGFAVLQMFIQIIFFLHLGRGPKPLYNVGFFAGTVSVIVLIIVGSLFIMSHLHYNMTPGQATKQLTQDEGISQIEGQATGACAQIGVNHTIIIANSIATPAHTDAKLCDTLTFVNQDNVIRDLAFGPHENHVPYGSVKEIQIRKKQSGALTLNVAGAYPFHDHLDATMSGSFTVTP